MPPCHSFRSAFAPFTPSLLLHCDANRNNKLNGSVCVCMQPPVSARCRAALFLRFLRFPGSVAGGVAAALLRPQRTVTCGGSGSPLVSQFKCWFSSALLVSFGLWSPWPGGLRLAGRCCCSSWLGEVTPTTRLCCIHSAGLCRDSGDLSVPRKASAELDLKERRSGLAELLAAFLALRVALSLVCKHAVRRLSWLSPAERRGVQATVLVPVLPVSVPALSRRPRWPTS